MNDSMDTQDFIVCDNGIFRKLKYPASTENDNKNDILIRKYFKYGYYFILFSFIFSVIATLFVKDNKHRLILFFEILITGASSYMYYLFNKSLDKTKENLNLKYIDKLRYKGWSISTPLMLSVLCMVLSNSTGIPLTINFIGLIIILNYIMLSFGYLGEIEYLNKVIANILGFIPFFAMFYLIFITFILKYNFFNYVVYFVYLTLWSLYGIAYLLDEVTKNLITNFLDVTAKGVFAFGIAIAYLFFSKY